MDLAERYVTAMFRPGIVRDLSVLTATKLAVILLIYALLFAPFASRPDDTAAHLLGVHHQTTPEGS